MHFLEATFRLVLQNKGVKEPIEIPYLNTLTQKHLQVCRNGYNLAKDLYNLGLTSITRYKDHERFFVVIEFCNEPNV